ncbi:hypothetical protein GCM10027082_30070 [Comamonas humi]
MLRSSVVAFTMALSCAASWAARDFTPQAGTWVISSEVDGKPGRGLAIDVQGNTFFMQVFGYEKLGPATFYTATGQLEGNTVTAPLVRYQGGHSFGSDARDAVEDGSPGSVTVSFANGLQGTVQFPGEEEMAIKRFEMRSADFVSNYWEMGRPRHFIGAVMDADLRSRWAVTMGIWKSGDPAGWRLSIGGLHSRYSYGGKEFSCVQVEGKDAFRCTSDGVQPSDYQGPDIRSIDVNIFNIDVAGVVEIQDRGAVQAYQMMGVAVAASGGVAITGCVAYADVYVGDVRNCNRAVTPSSGTWVVEDELLGKPGRGLAIDVQNGMALAQVFNYLPGGAPTFHMGSGTYKGIETRFALNRYEGGRALGGSASSAQLVDTAGELAMKFSSGDAELELPSRVRGSAQLPGEPDKRIVRMALEPGATTAQGLLGQWWLLFWTEGQGNDVQLVTLTQVVGDEARSEDGSIRCSRPDPVFPSRATCVWHRGGFTSQAYLFQEPGNRSGSVLQVRDRHGNWMGLGNVPLD